MVYQSGVDINGFPVDLPEQLGGFHHRLCHPLCRGWRCRARGGGGGTCGGGFEKNQGKSWF